MSSPPLLPPAHPPPGPDLEHRLVRLESQLAHVDRLQEELNAIVTDQARQISKLHQQIRRLTESLEAAEADRILSTNPRPPHSG